MTFRTLRFGLEFLPLLALDKILSALPRRACIKAGELLGLLMSGVMRKRNTLIGANLARVFPEKKQAEINAIRRKVWINLGRVMGEFITLSDLRPDNFRNFLNVENEEILTQAIAQKKGVILVGFHFSNWELSGVGAALTNKNFLAVARPIKNPLVQTWIQKKRGSGGVDFILHRQAVRGCLKALKELKTVGILVDQNLYTGGVFVDFLGQQAATTTLPALLHERTGAPILLLYCLRDGDSMKLIYENAPAILPSESGDDPILALTKALNRRLGEIIRSQPESWFWIHNRWKRQPA